MKRLLLNASLAVALVASLTQSALGEGVRIVQAPTAAPFVDVQSAVDAAAPGDTLVVAGGEYAGFVVDGKALEIVVAPGQVASVVGTVTVRNVAAGETILLSGLEIRGAVLEETGLLIMDNPGHVRVEDCVVEGGPGGPDHPYFTDGGIGVDLRSSPRVAFARSTIRGGAGGSGSSLCYDCFGGDGDMALRVMLSSVALYHCTVVGGFGGDNGGGGGDAGDGAVVLNGTLHAVGTILRGGDGGDGLDFLPVYGGDGGDGLFVSSVSSADAFDCSLAGGGGGFVFSAPANSGAAGSAISGTGPVQQPMGSSRRFTAPTVAFSDEVLQVTVEGLPGDVVSFRVGGRARFGPLASGLGTRLIGRGPLDLAPVGVVPPSGQLTLRYTPSFPGTTPGDLVLLQGFGRSAAGTAFLASPMHVVVLDVQAAPDCNGNGVSDLADAIRGTSPDCGPNLVPDECDVDCDGNGVPDDCDLAAGTLSDCNGNRIPDVCDIASGTSSDCNLNGIPDSCDLATGTSFDTNANGVPDECEANGTFWVDASAAAGGTGTAAAPFQAIGDALAATIGGDEIIVRDGVYTGTANRELEVVAGDRVIRSENGSGSCIIDLQGIGRAFILSGGTPATRIEGFTMRNGQAMDGGAVYASFGAPVVRACVFVDCEATSQGGAILIAASDARIENCIFQSNEAGLWGGAIGFSGNVGDIRDVRVRRCLFGGNTSTDGGAIFMSGKYDLAVTHSVFLGNEATGSGGAIGMRTVANEAARVSIDNGLFAGNSSIGDGGAVASFPTTFTQPTRISITSSTFTQNTCGGSGSFLSLRRTSDASIANTIVWGNTAPQGEHVWLEDAAAVQQGLPAVNVEFSDIELGQGGVVAAAGTVLWLGGNLDIDPMFTDPDGPDNNPATLGDNNYRPLAGAPVNDAGSNARIEPDVNDIDEDGDVTEATPLDFRLAIRVLEDLLAPNSGSGTGALVDMGCYERD